MAEVTRSVFPFLYALVGASVALIAAVFVLLGFQDTTAAIVLLAVATLPLVFAMGTCIWAFNHA